MNDAIEQFRRAIHSAGLEPPEVIEADGRLHRFPTNGRASDDAGWYVLHDDRVPAGTFGDFRTGVKRNWRADIGRPLTIAEEKGHGARLAAMRRKREADEARRGEAAKATTTEVIEVSALAADDNPYLTRKRVSSVATLREIDAGGAAEILGYAPKSRGKPLAGRLLVVPVKVGGELRTLEFIDEAGRKAALYGGAKGGGYWDAQPLPEGDGTELTLLIGEGVATVLSAKEATGSPSIAALSCGNLPAVARGMCKRYPAAVLVILADLGNGMAKAAEAARAVGAVLALPDFGPNGADGATDFNGMAALCGLEAVAECIRRQIFSNDDVTDVTDVQGSCDAGSSCYVTKNRGDTDVTESAEGAIPDGEDGKPAAEGPIPEAEDGEPAAEGSIPPLSERPCFRVFDKWVEHHNGNLRPGVWFFGIKQGRKAEEPPTPTQQWVCSPLYIEAVACDGQKNNFGRLLRFRNTVGSWREWAMPMELLRGLGDELRGELLAMGVEIDPQSKFLLAQYLQSVHPKRRVRCALQVGWCGDSFVLPDEVVGARASGVIFQSGERWHDEYTRAGTLAGWRSEIAARATGNPLLRLALSASFAGPMLGRCNAEGGGFHLVGDSSTGKTAAIEAACSTWGGANYRRSWRATANGMEGAAALFNDGLLALDEISECDPKEVGAIVYALGNGYGKQRASRTGNARTVTRWRCFILSSGERTIATHMAEGGRRAKAGQAVRLLDVPATRRHGAWDELHGFPSGAALSDAIKRAAVAHHGHAGPAFLEKLTRDKRDFSERLERIKALPEFSVEGGAGQDKRAAARFALVALAGEVATEYGITGWEEGEAIKAAVEVFKAWRSQRGRGNDERRQILEAVSGFIERHGDSRFSDADKDSETMRINRAGWWREEQGGRLYLFNKEGLREALLGFDFKRALDTLEEAGALPPADASGERSKPQRIGGRLARVYTVHPNKLQADHGA